MTVQHVGGFTQQVVRDLVGSGRSTKETLRTLDRYGIDWYISEQGTLIYRYWQVAAEGFVSPEHVGRLQTGRERPREADDLEWVSRNLDELRRAYANQWIAVADGRVLAHADTVAALLAQLKTLKSEHPLVTHITADPVNWITTYAG